MNVTYPHLLADGGHEADNTVMELLNLQLHLQTFPWTITSLIVTYVKATQTVKVIIITTRLFTLSCITESHINSPRMLNIHQWQNCINPILINYVMSSSFFLLPHWLPVHPPSKSNFPFNPQQIHNRLTCCHCPCHPIIIIIYRLLPHLLT